MLEVPYSCVSTDTAEELDTPLAADPAALVASLAAEKVAAARASGVTGLVLGFDTVVLDGSRILGKPADVGEARKMLGSLSGRTHQVATGVALLAPGDSDPELFAVITPVRMKNLSSSEIESWIERGEVLGCAGAYNIEHHLAEVDLDQCYQNVAGIPLCHLYAALCRLHERLGSPLPSSPVAPCDSARQERCLLGPRLVEDAGCPKP